MLDLSHNEYLGRIPLSFGNLKDLESLNLSHNYFRSPVPEELGNLKKLKALDLSYNLIEEIPDALTNLSNLEIAEFGRQGWQEK